MSALWRASVILAAAAFAAVGGLEVKARRTTAAGPAAASLSAARTTNPAMADGIPPTPAPLYRRPLEDAVHDPFLPAAAPPASPPPSAAAQVTEVTAEPPAAAPAAPPLNLRFTGRMRGPAGDLVVFALLGDEPVVLAAGAVLANGYRVDHVREDGVDLTYPPLGASGHLPVPTAPTFEIR